MSAEFRKQFTLRADRVHLNNAGISLLSLPAQAAAARALKEASEEGSHRMLERFGAVERSRSAFARFLGRETYEVALMPNCASGLSAVAMGFGLAAGDEIVRVDQEYPSNAYPWHAAARRTGAVVRIVRSRPDFQLDEEALLAAIGPRTRLVAVSWVQYQTGAVAPLTRLADACRSAGAKLVVDAIQGLGVLPFDWDTLGADYLCGGTHKWMCGPVGLGFFAAKRERLIELEPFVHGAASYTAYDEPLDPSKLPFADARRFEPGALPLAAIETAAASLELIQSIGVGKIAETALGLAKSLVEGLRRAGHTVLGPDVAHWPSPIVTFLPRGGSAEIEKAASKLEAAHISFAKRAGGFRLSPHGFNHADDIAAALAALA